MALHRYFAAESAVDVVHRLAYDMHSSASSMAVAAFVQAADDDMGRRQKRDGRDTGEPAELRQCLGIVVVDTRLALE